MTGFGVGHAQVWWSQQEETEVSFETVLEQVTGRFVSFSSKIFPSTDKFSSLEA